MKTSLVSKMRVALVAAIGLLLLLTGLPANAGNHDPRVMPPNAMVQGLTLSQWVETWHLYALAGCPITNSVYLNTNLIRLGNVLLLPGAWGTRKMNVRKDVYILLMVDSVFGQTFANPNKQPEQPALAAGWPSKVSMLNTLDGTPLQLNPRDYLTPVTWFPFPVYFGDGDGDADDISPTEKAVGAIWFRGYGILIKPLAPGDHVLKSQVNDAFFGQSWTDTWEIHVPN